MKANNTIPKPVKTINAASCGASAKAAETRSASEKPVIDSGRLTTPKGTLSYLELGCGKAAHFLHGNGFCAGAYLPFLNLLSRDLRITAPDIRGHGDSIHNGRPVFIKWPEFAEDARRIITTAMNPPVIGIGHSLGGVITYMTAALYPDLFSKIVLIDPVILPQDYLFSLFILRSFGLTNRLPLVRGAKRRKHTFTSQDEALSRFSKGKGAFRNWRHPFIKAYVDWGFKNAGNGNITLKCNPQNEARVYESVPLNLWSYASRIHVPTLFIRGEKSDNFPEKAMKRLMKLMPNANFFTFPKVGHFIPMEIPDELSTIVLEFIT